MEKNLYIDASHPDEIRVVLKSKNYIEEYEYENKNKLHLKNNIYLGKVSRIEPSLQAAFVNYGKQRHGFLAFNDIQSDYYQIPHDDKDKLKKDEKSLRLELKEKSKNVEENQKTQDQALVAKTRAGDEANKPLLNQINWIWVANLVAKKPELNPTSAELLDWVTSGQIEAMRK